MLILKSGAAALLMTLGLISSAYSASDKDACFTGAWDDTGIAACDRAIDGGTLKGHDLVRAHYERGRKYHGMGRLSEANKDYSSAIELDPKWAWPYVARGHAYADKKDFERAFADQETAIKLEPSAVTYTGRAMDLMAAGAYDRAIADLDEAVRLNPKYFYGQVRRGDTYMKKRDFAQAEIEYRKALELAAGDDDKESEAKEGLRRAKGRITD